MLHPQQQVSIRIHNIQSHPQPQLPWSPPQQLEPPPKPQNPFIAVTSLKKSVVFDYITHYESLLKFVSKI